MTLLVTGGCGFIGAAFIRQRLRTHPEETIVNLDALTYAGSPGRLADVQHHSRYRFLRGDITDPEMVAQAMAGCRAVVHLAAETHVDRSIVSAGAFIRTNVEGTQVLLEQARRQAVERFLYVSTDEVYGPVLSGAADERAPLAPRSPYAASKAAGDWLTHSYHHTYGLPVLVARPTNAYGPAQFPEKFIPLCLTHALAGRPIPIYGDGSQRRSWLFVDDLCTALSAVLDRGAVGESYNVGSGEERANRDTASAVLQLLGAPAALLQPVADRPGHDWRYALDDRKLRALGWRAQTPFRQGLEQTAGWYREHGGWWKPLAEQLQEQPQHHWLSRQPAAHAAPVSR